ncbi:unnamed protein product [Spirodela intermedia]|nr:unnamed protein product [Spirodela intermedia]CAA6666103.1 unnamed protein product [Spirodela intermedia]
MLDVEKPCEEFSTKELRKLRKEIYLLVEGVSSYISICSSRNCDGNGASDCLVPCFVDLVRIWTARRTDGGDALQEFFPFVNEEIRNALAKSGCQVRYLSGVVIAEVFLLMLRLKLQKTGGSSPELRSELKVWAVGSITGFKSLDFFEILLVLLLNGDLPSSLLVNPVDEAFLRDIIYDSVVPVEYSFLYPEREADNFSIENLDVARLIVTHQAIRAARGRGDQAKLTAYLNAFSRSALRSSLTKLITDRVGAEKLVGKNAASPESLLKWLLNLEDRGYKVHNFDLSRLQSKLLFDEPKASTVARPSESNRKEDGDIFFFDSKGGSSAEEETNDQEVEMMDDVFLSAARNMKSAPGDGRKRKGSKEGGERDIARFIRYKLHNHTAKDIPAPSKAAGEISGESDVENPPSDEEMEDSD